MGQANRFIGLASVILVWVVVMVFSNAAADSDVACLTSIKESIEDPFQYLNTTWDFSNQTQGFVCRFTGVECWNSMENRVLNLNLDNFGLKGNFPRGLANCTTLTGLNLSNNGFSGTIPSDISKILPFVTFLQLSSNNFSGAIPSDLANCSYINVLKLDHNRLTGRIPQEFSLFRRITRFDVADNFLTGPIPNISGTSAEDFANNPGLCGGPLPPCKTTF